jgi:hypothetical protein
MAIVAGTQTADVVDTLQSSLIPHAPS